MQAHKIFTIAKRDYIATVRTKAFLFGLLVAPILFGGGSIAASFFEPQPDLTDRRIAILDRAGTVADALVRSAQAKNQRELIDKKTGKQVSPRYVFEVIPPAPAAKDQLLALSDRVRRKDLAAFLEIGPQVLHPPARQQETDAKEDPSSRVSYYSNSGGIDEVRNWLSGPVEEGLRWARLVQSGIDPARIQDLSASVPFTRLSLLERDARTGQIRAAETRSEQAAFFVPFAVAMILAMIVMVGSSPMLQAVTQDKSQHVVEMLLASASPFELMAGKVLSAVAVSFTSSALYVAAGFFALNALGMAGMLPVTILPWFYVYLLADVVMLCSLAAALGAVCSTPQDAQNLAIVLLAPCIIPMFMFVAVLRDSNAALAVTLSLFPPFTPILMLLRQALPDGVPVWQPWAGLVGVVAFTLATVWAASRVFRVAILMHGKPPRLAELLRWALRG